MIILFYNYVIIIGKDTNFFSKGKIIHHFSIYTVLLLEHCNVVVIIKIGGVNHTAYFNIYLINQFI